MIFSASQPTSGLSGGIRGTGGTLAPNTGTTATSDPGTFQPLQPLTSTSLGTRTPVGGQTSATAGTPLVTPPATASTPSPTAAPSTAPAPGSPNYINPNYTGPTINGGGTAGPTTPGSPWVNGQYVASLDPHNAAYTGQTPAASGSSDNTQAIYGPQGNMTLPQFQQWQQQTFAQNQTQAAQQFQDATGNFGVSAVNPYTSYTQQPSTTPLPANLYNQLSPDAQASYNSAIGQINPSAPQQQPSTSPFQNPVIANLWGGGGPVYGQGQSYNPYNNLAFQQNSQNNPQYQGNYLNVLLNLLNQGGGMTSNRFGNGFSPLLSQGGGGGIPSYGNLAGLGNGFYY